MLKSVVGRGCEHAKLGRFVRRELETTNGRRLAPECGEIPIDTSAS